MTIWNSQTKQYHGNSEITSSNSEPALKITQTGTGDALIVQDDTDPDTTPFVIDASGNVIIGYESVVSSATAVLQIAGSSITSQVPAISVTLANNSIYAGSISLRKARGTIEIPAVINSGDTLSSFIGQGYDGAAYKQAGYITISSDGTPGINDMPGKISVFTTPDGSATPTERLRINSSGQLLINTGTAGASKLVVNDESIQINTAKTPAAANATGTAGQVCWDANYVYVCVATDTWKRAAIATWP
jgi:hypothetical protein